jgi:putative membrane protein
MMGRGWNGGGWDGGAWLAMMLVMVVFWGAVITAVVLFVRGSPRGHRDEHSHAAPGQDPALAILNERFAKGEIDAEEYTKRRDTLRSG